MDQQRLTSIGANSNIDLSEGTVEFNGSGML